ncbi:MAG: polyphosphate kinase 2 family protein [Kaiparowitsia implicata GSE-PSE-MK54-09C]|jgi:PPK2 family polyphosphate:nucleotide phosphotransferase|nr:polyphosphate kinase 2 family protein [Kaiparowitsia implicata GSE-PSE-MK54-09C]
MDIEQFIVKPSKGIQLKDFDPGFTGKYKKKDAKTLLQEGIDQLAEDQAKLYAQNTYSLLILFQAMDAAGKDSTIKHVMSGINPQGCQVYSFKAPSSKERDHDYLWRSMKALPERGRIGIHNRSYYEEVLVVRVHPNILASQQLPDAIKNSPNIWQQRFEEINHFEKYLVNNGIIVLKFFLNVSKDEQKERFIDRIDRPEKNWKFSVQDVKERAYWDDYMNAYEDMFQHTSTDWAPWHIIPADHKWYTRLAVSQVVCQRLEALNLRYPEVSDERRQELVEDKKLLENEA